MLDNSDTYTDYMLDNSDVQLCTFPAYTEYRPTKKELYHFVHSLQKKGKNLKPYLKPFLQAQQSL